MEPFAADLVAAFGERRESLFAIARRVLDTSMAGRYSDDELAQLLRGFETMMVEMLEGRGTVTRDFFVETAVPAVVAQGETDRSLVRSTATFAVLVATELADAVGPDRRSAAIAWLAEFFGDYAERVLAAAGAAEA